MQIVHTTPEKKYPYLAIWTGGEPLPNKISKDEVVIITMLIKDKESHLYLQCVDAAKSGCWLSEEAEKSYRPLPSGYKIEIVQ